jgi:hypothetical protein
MGALNIGVFRLYQSSIGKKVIMAVTGLVWIGYVILHMYGNIKAFEGPEYFNAYAEGLRSLGSPISAICSGLPAWFSSQPLFSMFGLPGNFPNGAGKAGRRSTRNMSKSRPTMLH